MLRVRGSMPYLAKKALGSPEIATSLVGGEAGVAVGVFSASSSDALGPRNQAHSLRFKLISRRATTLTAAVTNRCRSTASTRCVSTGESRGKCVSKRSRKPLCSNSCSSVSPDAKHLIKRPGSGEMTDSAPSCKSFAFDAPFDAPFSKFF